MAFTARDFEGAVSCASVRCVREKLFDVIGILRVPQVVAEQDHAIFYVSGLPVVEKMVGCGKRENVARIERICRLGRMAVGSGPDEVRKEEETYC